ncbi:styrene monooxygenase/indole monooxygenase family protein [Deinococcus apachensis]|uniref:styrene monooxygenase/indole monooxygenase family protein n=1 Tax=Deinococcus apachensis TaxID=309886 RepID=UPI00035CCAF2|nr:styrene monooxygenase/indole monooxygenase family protein [Deinococcus apachensis]
MTRTTDSIGILGTGIAGLQLALFLQHHGLPVTLYGEGPPISRIGARLPSLVLRTDATRARERALRVNHWDGLSDLTGWHTDVRGERPLRFTARFDRPLSGVDLRLYEARLLEDFVDRGGDFEVGTLEAWDLGRLGYRHALLVVATGRGGLSGLFPRDPQRSPFTAPQRLLIGALFEGGTEDEPREVRLSLTPGVGEVFEIPCLTFEGRRVGLVVEAVPGGPLEDFARAGYGSGEVAPALLGVLRDYAPQSFGRMDPGRFRLTRALNFLQGAVTPVVRRAFVPLENGRYAVALGDALCAHDPIVGQGANAASACAWVLGEQIVGAGGNLEATFRQATELRLWEVLRPTVELTTSALRPPTPHRLALLAACSQHPHLACAFMSLVHDPTRYWEVLATPEGVEDFLRGLGVAPACPPSAPAPLAARVRS